MSREDDVEDTREGFPDLLESHSDDYDYSSDSDFEEVEPPKVGESQATRLNGDALAAPGNEKRGDIIHIEKEDAQSEISEFMSPLDMESALDELDDIKCVHVAEDLPLS